MRAWIVVALLIATAAAGCSGPSQRMPDPPVVPSAAPTSTSSSTAVRPPCVSSTGPPEPVPPRQVLSQGSARENATLAVAALDPEARLLFVEAAEFGDMNPTGRPMLGEAVGDGAASSWTWAFLAKDGAAVLLWQWPAATVHRLPLLGTVLEPLQGGLPDLHTAAARLGLEAPACTSLSVEWLFWHDALGDALHVGGLHGSRIVPAILNDQGEALAPQGPQRSSLREALERARSLLAADEEVWSVSMQDPAWPIVTLEAAAIALRPSFGPTDGRGAFWSFEVRGPGGDRTLLLVEGRTISGPPSPHPSSLSFEGQDPLEVPDGMPDSPSIPEQNRSAAMTLVTLHGRTCWQWYESYGDIGATIAVDPYTGRRDRSCLGNDE